VDETTPHVVTSVLEPAMGRALVSLLAEWQTVQSSRAVILRTFNVYGPDIKTGVIPSFVKAAKAGKPLEVHGSGYQTRAFLHQDDFLRCTEIMVRKLLNGHKGVYNVGHDQETTVTRLADTVWQLHHKTSDPAPVTSIQPGRYYAQYKVANITRVRAAANWKPTISYRQGIWRLLEDGTDG
jgi:nucleoside-diphosphate-sugar epimerase